VRQERQGWPIGSSRRCARPTDFSDVSSAAAASTCSIWRGQDHEGPLPHPAQDQAQ
jgi:hypothetical protein